MGSNQTEPQTCATCRVRLQGLQREIDCEAAGQAAGTIARWEATLREVLWAARSHLGEHWEPFVAGIRANQQLAAMRGSPAKRTGPGRFPGLGQSITLNCPSPPEAVHSRQLRPR